MLSGGLPGSHTLDQALLLFGRPKSVVAFLRVLRGIDSQVDDSFTAVLQYDAPQQDLLVTVKTTIVTPMKDQLKYFVRGTKGSFVKVCCAVFLSLLFCPLHIYMSKNAHAMLSLLFLLVRFHVLTFDLLRSPWGKYHSTARARKNNKSSTVSRPRTRPSASKTPTSTAR